jgi:hypothetical protein
MMSYSADCFAWTLGLACVVGRFGWCHDGVGADDQDGRGRVVGGDLVDELPPQSEDARSDERLAAAVRPGPADTTTPFVATSICHR